MIGKTILHYKITEKLGEARLLMTCIGELADFTVAPDGRFLLVRSTVDFSKPLQIHVVTNTGLRN